MKQNPYVKLRKNVTTSILRIFLQISALIATFIFGLIALRTPVAYAANPPILDGLLDEIYLSHNGRAIEYEGFYPQARATLYVMDDASVDPDYIWLAWIISRDFNDASYGNNKHSSWPGGHAWDDLLESDLQRLDLENSCGEKVVDATMDLLDGPPYHAAYPTASGYGVSMDATESVKNYINGGDWSKFAYATSMAANLNNFGYCVNGDCSVGGTNLFLMSPPWLDQPNYIPVPSYANWEYSLIFELRIHRSVFVTANCPQGGILGIATNPVELHASPSKIKVSPVTLFRVTSAIGDYVWLDADRDGIQDIGEPGIANVTVALYSDPNGDGDPADGSLIMTTATDSNGRYLFPDLGSGNYVVRVTDENNVLAGFSLTTGSTDPHGPISLGRGERYLNADFGYAPSDTSKAIIGDYVWSDADNDGLQDLGEAGIGGVTVELLADNDRDGRYTDVVATTITADDGKYLFTGVTPGDYVVRVSDSGGVLTGYTLTSGPHSNPNPTRPIHVNAGDVYLNADFGYYKAGLGTIGNQVWLDLDGDGLYEPGSGEVGIANVTISLIKDANGNGRWDSGERVIATTTASDGTYLFSGLSLNDGDGDADYLVHVTDVYNVLSRYRKAIGPNPGSNNNSQADPYAVSLTAASPSNMTADFGFWFDQQGGLVGDRVWYDLDGDGIQDPGEPGIAGVQVALWQWTKKGQRGNQVGLVTTDANGYYYYPNLPIGSGQSNALRYQAEVVASNFAPGGPLEGWTGTNQPDNMAESIGLYTGNAVDLSLDFGYRFNSSNLYTIGNLVWEDSDNDGHKDSTESGIAGVTLALYRDLDEDGKVDSTDPMIAETVTDSGGGYSFTSLAGGHYIVVITDKNYILAGYSWTDGRDDTDNESQGIPYPVTVNPENVVYADFGFVRDPDDPPPTAVSLAAFTARLEGAMAIICWETSSEVNNVGFHIYRSLAGSSSEKIRLNEQLIPSQAPGSMMGASYSFRDESIAPGTAYEYWLEAVDTHGNSAFYGPAISQRSNSAPEAMGISPKNGNVQSGTWQVLKATYRDGDGADDLQSVFIAIADSVDRLDVGIQIRYDVQSGLAYLWQGNRWSEGKALGQDGKLENSQVIIRLAKSHAKMMNGDSIEFQCSLKFKASFKGQHTLYLRTVDKANADTGWLAKGKIKVK